MSFISKISRIPIDDISIDEEVTLDIKCYGTDGKLDIDGTLKHYHSLLLYGAFSGENGIEKTGFEVYSGDDKIDIQKTLEYTRRALVLTMSSLQNGDKNSDTILDSGGKVDTIATLKYQEYKKNSHVGRHDGLHLTYTGYEVYYENGVIDVDSSMNYINLSMRLRNPEKYGDFLKTIEGSIGIALEVMMIPNKKERLRLFRLIYFCMRLLDDVYDGDTNPPMSFEDKQAIYDMLSGQEYTGDVQKIKNPLIVRMIQEISDISEKLGIKAEILEALKNIMNSMGFDHLRSTSDDKIKSKIDLSQNFHFMDIIGTVAGTAMIFGIDPKQAIDLLTPLGEACRLIYNLQDFYEDVKVGLINIPQEDLQKFGITEKMLEDIKKFNEEKKLKYISLPREIKDWFHQEIKEINRLMEIHNRNMQQDFNFKVGSKWSITSSFLLTKTRKIREWVMKDKVLPQTYTNEIKRDVFVISRLVR